MDFIYNDIEKKQTVRQHKTQRKATMQNLERDAARDGVPHVVQRLQHQVASVAERNARLRHQHRPRQRCSGRQQAKAI